jgi:hypothetical protein
MCPRFQPTPKRAFEVIGRHARNRLLRVMHDHQLRSSATRDGKVVALGHHRRDYVSICLDVRIP